MIKPKYITQGGRKNMNKYFENKIIPYVGIEAFKFGDKFSDIKNKVKSEHLSIQQTERSNKGCDIDWPWIILTVENSITLVFVKDVLFEIVLANSYKGKLPNGCCIGTSLKELEKLDSSLAYNEIEEDYFSKEGYWITEDEFGNIDSITVYVKEIAEPSFYKYEWLERYL